MTNRILDSENAGAWPTLGCVVSVAVPLVDVLKQLLDEGFFCCMLGTTATRNSAANRPLAPEGRKLPLHSRHPHVEPVQASACFIGEGARLRAHQADQFECLLGGLHFESCRVAGFALGLGCLPSSRLN